MPTTIKLRRGKEANLPRLYTGEIALTTDTETLFCGAGAGTYNVPINSIRLVKDTPQYPTGALTVDRYILNAHNPITNNVAIDFRSRIVGETRFDGMAEHSFAAGFGTKALGVYSFVTGRYNTADGVASVCGGQDNLADGNHTIVMGYKNKATGEHSVCAGSNNNTSGVSSLCVGEYLLNGTYLMTTLGRFNVSSLGSSSVYNVNNNALIIGNGASDTARSNCFRVTFGGKVYGLAAYNSTGADYGEYFEWLDGNEFSEDRIGRFVKLNEDKIEIANSDTDDILGVVSGTCSVIGNSYSDTWKDMYLKDPFGRYLYETKFDDGVEIKTLKLNPEYNHEVPYEPREVRKEWDSIGLLGRIRIIDDGSCQPNGYCKCGKDGIAVSAATGYRVLKRITDNIVEILFK